MMNITCRMRWLIDGAPDPRTARTMSRKSTVRIGTHNGHFHCSEVLACALLKLLPQYKDASIVRSEDKSVLDTCDIVVGVGGEYDPSRHRYDHNMKEFQEWINTIIRKPEHHGRVKLTSAVLIYYQFGHEILRNVLSDVTEDRIINEMFTFIYAKLISEIDTMNEHKCKLESYTDLSARVCRLNPLWDSQDEEKDKQFEKAMALVREEFLEIVKDAKNIRLPSMDIVRHAVENRFEVDPSGEIIMLSKVVSYEEYLFKLEKEMNVSPSIKYVIWKVRNIYCIGCVQECWVYRMLFPKAWGGMSHDTLVEACGIEGALHVHPDLYVGGHETEGGAVTMARKALEIEKTVQGEDDV
ncbi:MYG1 exonuclease-like [Temnothorax nylanderi]|uniref:MYG1 exonuclease-like n=1 Tax=Temnothorax nylanderi TaxID=102681 RepID=UPI003A8AEC67